MVQRSDSVWDGLPGGAAVFARLPRPCQDTERGDPDPELARIRLRLYHSRRWVHASFAPGDGSIAGNAMALYGVSGSRTPGAKAGAEQRS